MWGYKEIFFFSKIHYYTMCFLTFFLKIIKDINIMVLQFPYNQCLNGWSGYFWDNVQFSYWKGKKWLVENLKRYPASLKIMSYSLNQAVGYKPSILLLFKTLTFFTYSVFVVNEKLNPHKLNFLQIKQFNQVYEKFKIIITQN